MPKFIKPPQQDDDVLFVALDKAPSGKDAKKAYVLKQTETLEGELLDVKPSATYKYVFTIMPKGAKKPVLFTGKTDLINKLGYGMKPILVDGKIFKAEKGDLVRITYTEHKKTQKGHDWYDFDIEIAKAG